MSRESASAVPVQKVLLVEDAEHPDQHPAPRAKHLSQPRISPHRERGRELAAVALGRARERTGTTQQSIANILRVSSELIQRWEDPSCPKHASAGDLAGVAVAGSPTLYFAYLDELARIVRPHVKPGRTPFDHAMAIVHTSGAASSALTFEADRSLAVRRLRAVRQAADDALADIEESA